MIEKIEQAIASRHFAGGAAEVFEAANQGRIELLIAPENELISAWVNDEKTQVLEPNSGIEIPDIVDETVERVLDTGGKILFLPAEDLEKYGKLAAILRY
jgi:stalled ribosome rescue protein Dom34